MDDIILINSFSLLFYLYHSYERLSLLTIGLLPIRRKVYRKKNDQIHAIYVLHMLRLLCGLKVATYHPQAAGVLLFEGLSM